MYECEVAQIELFCPNVSYEEQPYYSLLFLGRISSRMKEARQQQRVNRAEFYGITVNQDDFVDQLAPTTCASSDDEKPCLSAYSLPRTIITIVVNGRVRRRIRPDTNVYNSEHDGIRSFFAVFLDS